MSTDDLAAVVLAGTHHWSGSPFERLAPRPLVPVALDPLITYPLRWLARGGVRQATICANGTTPAIQAVVGGGRDLDIEVGYYEDATPRGAAGCVRDAGLRTGCRTLVVADGTAIPTVDLAELLASHYASGAAVTAVVHRESSPSAPATASGVYVFERRALDHVAETGFQDIKENLIPKLHRAGERVVAYQSGTFCPHVFNAQTYLAVSDWMIQRLARETESAGGSLVHPDACVEPGARLVGPVQLGPGARVQAGATIVGPTSIGENSTVGRNALVARSVVWSRCELGERSVVHGCIVGDDAVVPATTGLFNIVRPWSQSLSRLMAPRPRPRSSASPAAPPELVSAPPSAVPPSWTIA